jgi:DNA-3-methyladenine glycosylase
MTKRNEVMFQEGGHLYVYFTYGMHYCCNIVTEKEGKARAVLLRAIEPVLGIDRMLRNRGRKGKKVRDSDIANGPAKLCESFGISRTENGADLLGNDIFIAKGVKISQWNIRSSPRIGIREATDKKWRFYLRGNEFVSKVPKPKKK